MFDNAPDILKETQGQGVWTRVSNLLKEHQELIPPESMHSTVPTIDVPTVGPTAAYGIENTVTMDVDGSDDVHVIQQEETLHAADTHGFENDELAPFIQSENSGASGPDDTDDELQLVCSSGVSSCRSSVAFDDNHECEWDCLTIYP